MLSGGMGWGALFVILTGACDVLDGQLAKVQNSVTRFGTLLDATMDRVSEGFIYLGFLGYFGFRGEPAHAFFAYVSLVGSYLVSYVRARAELHVQSLTAGFWERPERLVFLILALAAGRPDRAVLVLAFFAPLTALQRVFVAWEAIEGRPCFWASWRGPLGALGKVLFWNYKRYSWQYDAYCMVAVLVVFL